MAGLHRLALLLLLAVVGTAVYANVFCRSYVAIGITSCGPVASPDCTNKGTGTYTTVAGAMPSTGVNVNVEAVCTAAVGAGAVFMGYNFNVGAASNWYACEVKNATTYYRVRVAITEYASCDAASCQAKLGMSAGRLNHDTGVSPPAAPPTLSTLRYACVPLEGQTGCVAETDPDIAFVDNAWDNFQSTGTGTQTWHVQGPSKYTGATCNWTVTGTGLSGTSTLPSGVTDKPVEPSPCPAGKVPATINDTTVCVTPGTDQPVVTEKKDEKKVVNADGSTTTTTTTTTTTCTGSGSCTSVTNVTVNNTPSTGGSGTTTSSVTSGTCTTTVGCGLGSSGESAFGGTCTTNFTCTSEDATSCAIAIAVNQSKCIADKFMVEDSALKTAGQNAISNSSTTSTSSISVGSLDTSNPFGSTCPTPPTVMVAGVSRTVPIPCDALQAMGMILIAVSLFVAARIAGGA